MTPSPRALELAAPDGDPRMAELVLRESRAIVRRRGSLLIAETHHGFVCASAGIDRSNAAGPGTAVLLPVDPDASAAALRERGWPRPPAATWRWWWPTRWAGRCETASSAPPSASAAWRRCAATRASSDAAGYTLRTTQVAVADELAAAADLVLGKLERVPAALVRGFAGGGDGSARELVREPERDLFR